MGLLSPKVVLEAPFSDRASRGRVSHRVSTRAVIDLLMTLFYDRTWLGLLLILLSLHSNGVELKRLDCPKFSAPAQRDDTTYFFFDPSEKCDPVRLMASVVESRIKTSEREPLPNLTFWPRVLRKPQPYRWYKTNTQNITLGFTQHATWFLKRFDLPDTLRRDAILSIKNPAIDELNVWVFHSAGKLIHHFLAGDQFLFEQRPIKNVNFIFPVTYPDQLEGRQSIWVLLRVKNPDSMRLHLKLLEKKQFFEDDSQQNFQQGSYLGIMLAMLIYNLVLMFSLRDKEYSIYAFWVICITMVVLSDNGHAFQYLWPHNGQWNNYSIAIFSAFGAMSAGFFCLATMNAFHNVPKFLARLLQLSSTGLAMLGFMGIFQLLPAYWALQLSLMGNVINIGFILIISFICVLKKVPLSKSYLIAWSMVTLGGGSRIMDSFGLASNSITIAAMQIGSALEVLLMSVLLSARVLEDRRRSEVSQQKIILLQQTMNEELEKKVALRTQELDALNQRLKALSTTDPLTGLGNRRHFDQALDQAFDNANRSHKVFYLLILDLDYFKKINDTYGHAFGDVCLQHIAQIIKNHCGRSTDISARFGGEEFVILLQHISAETAETIANRIRIALMNSHLVYGNAVVQLTCSIGVASNQPSDTAASQILERADKMLYEAKGDGRNCVKGDISGASHLQPANRP